jgi:hypothetical protein
MRLQQLLKPQPEPPDGERRRAYRRALQTFEKVLGADGGAKAYERRVQINYEHELCSDSPRIADKLARYEGAYALTRMQADNLCFYQDILVLKVTRRTKLLVTLIAPSAIFRGFGYLVQGGLFCPIMGQDIAAGRRRVASLLIARDATERTDIMCGFLVGLSNEGIHPVSLPVFFSKIDGPSDKLMNIDELAEDQIRRRVARYDNKLRADDTTLKDFYGVPARQEGSIGYALLNPATVNSPFRANPDSPIRPSDALMRLCRKW